MNTPVTENRLPPAPPRIVAISGTIFAALYFASVVLIRLAIPADPTETGAWLADPASGNWVRFALNLVPFTGIAFLWFMGVLRNRIGILEDRFFATVFLGSGLLFVATLFVDAALVQGLLTTFGAEGSRPTHSEAYAVVRATCYSLMNIFGVKMAAVFIAVTSTIGLRTARFPRWMVLVGFALALVMLLTITDFAWIALVFPSWVLLLSAYILVSELGARQQTGVQSETERLGGPVGESVIGAGSPLKPRWAMSAERDRLVETRRPGIPWKKWART